MSSHIFDTYVIVDWSARSKPSPQHPSKDAIWWAVARGLKVETPVYVRTRAEAIHRLTALLAEELAAGRRVVVGFDFPFGYPKGTAEVITGEASALALWDWLEDRIDGANDNKNNRFTVAEKINAHFSGIGPFWGRPATWPHPGIPTRGSERVRADHPPERRLVESHQRKAQPVWKLFTTGSVGSQVLLGLPALNQLRRALPEVAVWPFETGLAESDAPIVFAEIYPSLLANDVRSAQEPGEITDAAQVRVNAIAFARADANGRLAAMFTGSPDLTSSERTVIEQEEAWILGVGFEEHLRSRT